MQSIWKLQGWVLGAAASCHRHIHSRTQKAALGAWNLTPKQTLLRDTTLSLTATAVFFTAAVSLKAGPVDIPSEEGGGN